jgi:SNF2 family DNA or RNA helicase
MIPLLYPYQETAASWLAGRQVGYNALEMGLGKTRVTLRAMQLAGFKRGSVICPAVVREMWREEAKNFNIELVVDSYDRVTSNPEARTAILGGAVGSTPVLILDEAHYLKSWSAQRTNVILGSGDGLFAQVRRSETDGARGRVWMLSGTPMPRNPSELYPVMYAAGLYDGNYQSFLDRFCVYKVTRYGVKVTGHRNLKELQTLLRLSRDPNSNPFLLRLKASWVAKDLPPLRWGMIPLDVEDLSGLESLDASTLGALRNGTLPPMSANLARWLHKVGDLKAHAAVDLLRNELSSDVECKRVVFAHHKSVIETLHRGLEEFGIVTLTGDTPEWRRTDARQTFRHDPRCRVFLGQVTACSHGLDGLQYAAHEIVLVEPVWASHINVQAAHRLARLGQTKPVQVRMLSLANTPDRWVIAQHHREVQLVSEVIDT